MSSTWFDYVAYGLHLRSELELPELNPLGSRTEAEADVVITRGHVELPAHFQGRGSHSSLNWQTADLFWQHTGKFHLEAGRRIEVEAEPGVSEALLRPFLLGPVLAFLLHQRGALVLHASAVALRLSNVPETAVGFLGQSHSGKSTMASALYERGHRALSDDLVAVPTTSPAPMASEKIAPNATQPSTQPPTQPLLFPGLPHLKLRPPTVALLGRELDSLHHWHPAHEGYLMRLYGAGEAFQAAPLEALYRLEEGPELHIEAMAPQEALMTLANNSFCVRALQAEGKAENFLQCARLLQQVPVFRLQRPRRLELLAEVALLVEAHQSRLRASKN